jgi:lipoyl(octanoyl) transferase
VCVQAIFTELIEVLDPEPHAAAMNMAIDEVLLREATQPVLRIYRWREPAVSFGYFGSFAEAEKVAVGRELVRRWTGGGIVEHGDDVTYTLVVPREHSFAKHAAPESYRLIHEAIARAMAGEGIEVLPVAGAGNSGECFASPVQYDLVARGRKIGGAAQRRTKWGLLHQGSVRAEVPLPGLATKLAPAFAATSSQCGLTEAQLNRAQELAGIKYETEAWLRKC